MAHIHNQKGQHDQTASAFIIRLDTDEPQLMMHIHKKMGIYLQFGGHVELNETPWQAIAHELQEESGYNLSDLKILQPKDRIKYLSTETLHPYPVCMNTHPIGLNHYHTDVVYAFTAFGPPNKPMHEGESKEVALFTQAELMQLTDEQTVPSMREISAFIFDYCLPHWEAVDTSAFQL